MSIKQAIFEYLDNAAVDSNYAKQSTEQIMTELRQIVEEWKCTMTDINPVAKPCGNCGSKNLFPRWDSQTGEGWTHCDGCGRVSKALPCSLGRSRLIHQWNMEQEKAHDEDLQGRLGSER